MEACRHHLAVWNDMQTHIFAIAPFRDLELDSSVLALPMRQQHVDGDAPRNNASISYLLSAVIFHALVWSAFFFSFFSELALSHILTHRIRKLLVY
jgi:hypothetical protein